MSTILFVLESAEKCAQDVSRLLFQ